MSEQQRTKIHGGSRRSGGGSTKTGKSKRPAHKVMVKGTSEEGVGVSKIKAALRQTKRLLAKDNLSASVKQEAERKLIALEDELNSKETQQKEKKNAQRSHKIRFFERQKLVRRIKKLKKAREEDEDEEVDKELLEARVLLNYVLHYPMTQKYVALFPNQGPSIQEEAGETETDKSTFDEKASKIKERVRDSMKKGHLSNEPEMELELRSNQEPGTRKRLQEDVDNDSDDGARGKQSKAQKSTLEDDDFFAGSDE